MSKGVPVKYIVFDLDKTLIFTFEQSSMEVLSKTHLTTDSFFFPVQDRLYTIELELDQGAGRLVHTTGGLAYGATDSVEHMWGCVRPNAREFLKFCFMHFDAVIVWTAGIMSYAIAICEVLFQGLPKPHLIWTRGNCVLREGLKTSIAKDMLNLGYIVMSHPEYTFMVESANVPEENSDILAMNAKPLDFLASYLDQHSSKIENWSIFEGAVGDNFMIVEDNYQSFITDDKLRAFFIDAFEDPRKKLDKGGDNLLGTPGYSPFKNKIDKDIFETSDEYNTFVQNCYDLNLTKEDIDEVIRNTPYTKEKTKQKPDIAESIFVTSNITHHVSANMEILKTRILYNWLLRDDETLVRLQNLLQDNIGETCEELSKKWNKLRYSFFSNR